MTLAKEILALKPVIGKRVEERLMSFKKNEYFSELCFCLLTSNSKAQTAWNIQKELKTEGFLKLPKAKLIKVIRKHKHRFHNMKAGYIIEARKHYGFKLPKNQQDAREWLVKNVKGIGYKEASHFLRNTGHLDVAILDRHVLRVMYEHKLIKEIPKTLNKSTYLSIEKILDKFCQKLSMPQGELDFYLWYLKAGDVKK